MAKRREEKAESKETKKKEEKAKKDDTPSEQSQISENEKDEQIEVSEKKEKKKDKKEKKDKIELLFKDKEFPGWKKASLELLKESGRRAEMKLKKLIKLIWANYEKSETFKSLSLAQ